MTLTPEKCKIRRPDFRCCLPGAQPFTFVFERKFYNKPTKQQLAEYRQNKVIVESHGGQMAIPYEDECAGEAPKYEPADLAEMRAAVTKAYPQLEIVSCWNGLGAYTYSVGAKLKRPGKGVKK